MATTLSDPKRVIYSTMIDIGAKSQLFKTELWRIAKMTELDLALSFMERIFAASIVQQAKDKIRRILPGD